MAPTNADGLPDPIPTPGDPNQGPTPDTGNPPTDNTPAPTPDCNTCRTGCLFVTDFVLVDADTDLNANDPTQDYLVTLTEGQEYSISSLQQQFGVTNFALLCITDPLPFALNPFEIGSVGMRDNSFRTHEGTAGYRSDLDYNTEGAPPYTLADDDSYLLELKERFGIDLDAVYADLQPVSPQP